MPEAALTGSPGPAALLLRLERARDPEEVRGIVRELIDRLRGPQYLSLRRAFTVWLGRVALARSGMTSEIPEFQDLQEAAVAVVLFFCLPPAGGVGLAPRFGHPLPPAAQAAKPMCRAEAASRRKKENKSEEDLSPYPCRSCSSIWGKALACESMAVADWVSTWLRTKVVISVATSTSEVRDSAFCRFSA